MFYAAAETAFLLAFFVFCDVLIKNFKGKKPSSFAKEGLFVSQWRERKALFYNNAKNRHDKDERL
ncbi:MAG: hypothetical protein ACLR4A_02095 [Christensenellales bacterium]